MPALTFELPIPGPALSPNARGHWAVKAAAVKAARAAARGEAVRVLDSAGLRAPRWEKARYRAMLFHVGARTPDPDNFLASLKAYLDGLADVGIVANDRGLWPERPEYRQVAIMPRVEITIEPE